MGYIKVLMLALLSLVICDTAYAQVYPPVNKQVHKFGRGVAKTDVNGVMYWNCEATIVALREAGNDPRIMISIQYNAWLDGEYNTSGVGWNMTAVVGNGSLWEGTPFNSGTVDGRQGWMTVKTMVHYPGFYTLGTSITGYAWSGGGTTWTLDLSEEWLVDPDTGDPGPNYPPGGSTGGYSGPSVSWWEEFKAWLASLFSVTEERQAELQALKERWATCGPMGEMATVRNNMAVGNLSGTPWASEEGMPSSTLIWTYNYDSEGNKLPVAASDSFKVVDMDFDTITHGEGPVHKDAYSPWLNVTSLTGWRATFRKIFGWAVYGAALIAFVAWAKGRFVST